MRFLHKRTQGGRKPMIAASHTLIRVHPLLYNRPFPFFSNDKCMQIKLETILYGCIIYFGCQFAVSDQLVSIQPGLVGYFQKLVGRLPRKLTSSSANIDSQFFRPAIDRFPQRIHHRCRDAGRMPVHTEYTSQRLEPERIA